MPMGKYKDFDACVRANSDKKNPKAYCAEIMHRVEEGEELEKKALEIMDVSEAEFSTDEATGRMSAKLHIIKAGRAKGKKREYTSGALRKAAKEGVYNGLRMFVDHSDKPPLKRSFREMVSAVESTEYDPKSDSVVGDVTFFNKDFFEQAQAAKKYMGVSADHKIAVTRVKEGRDAIERVNRIVEAHSVDWVLYPAAGGEIISFARESEGAEDVEWGDITPELLKEKAPDVYSQIVKESAGPGDDDEDEGAEGAKNKKTTQESETVTLTKDEITKLVQEQVQSIQTQAQESQKKVAATGKRVREYIGKAGLPQRTAARVISLFDGDEEFDEAKVKEAVDEAKAELKEAGVGPRISNMGASGRAQEGEEEHEETVRESVEEFFVGKKNKKATTSAASGKES